MPKTMSGKKVKKVMEDRGWVVDSSVGGHFFMVNPDHPELGKVTVPVHGNHDLKPRVFASIKRQSKINFFE